MCYMYVAFLCCMHKIFIGHSKMRIIFFRTQFIINSIHDRLCDVSIRPLLN